MRIENIRLSDIYVTEEVLRDYADREKLEELKDSMSKYGLLNPITVKDLGDGTYKLIAGLRRVIAAKELGWETIPAHVIDSQDDDVDDIVTLEENIKREDVTPVQEGKWFKRLMARGMTMQEIAERIGKSLSYVQQRVELVEAERDLQEAVEQGRISFSVAREILGIKNMQDREYIKNLAITTGANVDQIRAWKKSLEEDRKMVSTTFEYSVSPPSQEEDTIPVTVCPLCKREYPVGMGIAIVFCPECYNIVKSSLEEGGVGDDNT